MSSQLSLFLSKDAASPWTVRESRRARRLSVRVYPAGRVEVVVPPRTAASLVQQFVSRHRSWIDERLRECRTAENPNTLPQALNLQAVGRQFRIESVPATGRPRVSFLQADELRIKGDFADQRLWSHALCRWLIDFAQQEMGQRLSALAAEVGLDYQRLQIRRQRTRWGSCSSRGAISLNVCGLFLPPPVLRYLFVHELCHTRHMNHSKRFWSLVEALEPDYARLDRELTRGWRDVPTWMFLS